MKALIFGSPDHARRRRMNRPCLWHGVCYTTCFGSERRDSECYHEHSRFSHVREMRGGRMDAIVGGLERAAMHTSRLRGLLMCCAVAALVGGCQTASYPPAPVSSATPDFDYHIGPLDTVTVI